MKVEIGSSSLGKTLRKSFREQHDPRSSCTSAPAATVYYNYSGVSPCLNVHFFCILLRACRGIFAQLAIIRGSVMQKRANKWKCDAAQQKRPQIFDRRTDCHRTAWGLFQFTRTKRRMFSISTCFPGLWELCR